MEEDTALAQEWEGGEEVGVKSQLIITFFLNSLPINTVAVSAEEEKFVFFSSRIYICPTCGYEWGRLVRSDHERPAATGLRFMVEERYCDQHDAHMWDASLAGCFQLHPTYIEPWFPREILMRDLLRQLAIKDAIRARLPNP